MGRAALLALMLLAAGHTPARAGGAAGAGVPSRPPVGFRERVITDSLDSPVHMAIAPDGRIFVCEQAGLVRVIRDGRLLPGPFLRVPTVANMEEGLLAVEFDPAFARNHFVYVLYTAQEPRRHGRLVRVTADGDTAVGASATTLLDLDPDYAPIHVGGGLRFGIDGRLYVGTGDCDQDLLPQELQSTHGKILRIAADGSIPPDNPFVAIARGKYRAIWARGFRNAFSLDVQPGTGRLFVNDVGGANFEEIDDGVAGANYGWPLFEGPSSRAGYAAPLFSYAHAQGCAITGGAFYGAEVRGFPERWKGGYFFADYCAGEIRWLDPATPARARTFARTLRPGPVDVRVGPDGTLYYLVRGNALPTGGAHVPGGALVALHAVAGRVHRRLTP